MRCRLVKVTLLALVGIFWLQLGAAYAAQPSHLGTTPLATGSLPSRIMPDGRVCLSDPQHPSRCLMKLMQVPRTLLHAQWATFYGVFDLDGDGTPEIFFDYWPPLDQAADDNVILLVYKKIRGRYRQYIKLKAPSLGYAPGGWFLTEPPHPKAIFQTRVGGSSGHGLFYLNLKTKSLDWITQDVLLEGKPQFEDLDGDGRAEIFLPGRGRDRTSPLGAAILHWTDEGYRIWWPDWTGLPYVMYARLDDLDVDGQKEIVAVLEPDSHDYAHYAPGNIIARRELGVWKIRNGTPMLVSKAPLPDARYIDQPYFDEIGVGGVEVELTYTRTVQCRFRDSDIQCKEREGP